MWKRMFRQAARAHIANIRWRKANGMPYNVRIEDLRYCLSQRHKAD